MSPEALGGNKTETKPSLFEGIIWNLPTDINLLIPAANALREKLIEGGWTELRDMDPEEEEHKAETAFKEALSNAIAHGNLGITKKDGEGKSIFILAQEEQQAHPKKMKKKVVVKILALTDKYVTIEIIDEGKGFDPKAPRAFKMESGKGLQTMKEELCKSVEHFNGGRKIRFTVER